MSTSSQTPRVTVERNPGGNTEMYVPAGSTPREIVDAMAAAGMLRIDGGGLRGRPLYLLDVRHSGSGYQVLFTPAMEWLD